MNEKTLEIISAFRIACLVVDSTLRKGRDREPPHALCIYIRAHLHTLQTRKTNESNEKAPISYSPFVEGSYQPSSSSWHCRKREKGEMERKGRKNQDVTMETDSEAPGTSAKILGLVQDAGKPVQERACAQRQSRWCWQPLAQRTLLECCSNFKSLSLASSTDLRDRNTACSQVCQYDACCAHMWKVRLCLLVQKTNVFWNAPFFIICEN